MQITHAQLEEDWLAAFGIEAVNLLCCGKFSDLAERFGYALAFDRNPMKAIEQDLACCLNELQAVALAPLGRNAPKVSYFQPNDTGLVALLELLVPTNNGQQVLVELVVTGNGSELHITLEELSAVKELSAVEELSAVA